MGWQLAPQVSYCLAQRQAVFLDVGRDRYFGLPPGTNHAFQAWIEDQTGDPPTMLVQAGLLVPDRATTTRVTAFSIAIPGVSVRDLPSGRGGARRSGTAKAVAGIYAARWRSRAVRLADLLHQLQARRDRMPIAAPGCPAYIAQGFARVRAWQPLKRACLPDSVALFEFLAAAGLPSTLVFGVTARPFAAHCWVQTPEMLLNEDSDIVSRFTPIFAV